MKGRTELLAAAREPEPTALIQLVGENGTGIDLGETLSVFFKDDHRQLWEGVVCCLEKTFRVTLEQISQQEEGNTVEPAKEFINHLEATCTLALCALTTDPPICTPKFQAAVQMVHDVCFVLDSENNPTLYALQDNISRVCEHWVRADLPNKTELVPYTLLFLLRAATQPSATGAQIKRLYQSRDMLSLIDWDCSSDALQLCGLCMATPLFLRNEDGRRFLAYVMALNETLTKELHAAIKTQLHKSNATKYGEIIFKAWKNAAEPVVECIERHVIQDLMHHAIHAAKNPADGKGEIGSALRQLLGYLHSQKKQKGVDEMLLRLYNPILWRALKVANPLVRANASYLLIDAFPLHNPEGRRRETDELLQKQFDTLATLLKDTDAAVRAHAVGGVCHVLKEFWELIPIETTSELLEVLVNDLAYDASSPAVRLAVCEGMNNLLSNPLAIPSLKVALPRLGPLIHDTSETVRLALVKVLLAVRDIRGIRFWDVVALDSLILRLDRDGDKMADLLTRLLLNTYFPQDKPDKHIVRCVLLLELGRGAARRFYMHLPRHVNSGVLIGFLLQLTASLAQSADRAVTAVANASKESGKGQKRGKKRKVQQENQEQEAGEEGGTQNLDSTDMAVIEGALEVLAIVHTACMGQFASHPERHTGLQQQVPRDLSSALPRLFAAYGHSQNAVAALTKLATAMPREHVQFVCAEAFKKLRDVSISYTDQAGPATLSSKVDPTHVLDVKTYGPIIEAVCSWGMVEDLLTLISESLSATLNGPDGGKKAGGRGGKRAKTAAPAPVAPGSTLPPLVAVRYLDYLMACKGCRQAVVQPEHVAVLDLIGSLLAKSRDLIARRMKASEPLSSDGGDLTDLLLSEALGAYCRLTVHRALIGYDDAQPVPSVPTEISELLDYTESLCSLLSSEGQSKKAGGRGKRGAEAGQTRPELFIGPLLGILVEMVTIGYSDEIYEAKLAEIFLGLLAENGHARQYLCAGCKALFQLVDKSGVCEGLIPLADAVVKAACVGAEDETSQTMAVVRACLLSLLQVYRRKNNLDLLAGVLVAAVTQWETEPDSEEDNQGSVPVAGPVGRMVAEAAVGLREAKLFVSLLCQQLEVLPSIGPEDEVVDAAMNVAARSVALLASLLKGPVDVQVAAEVRDCLGRVTASPLIQIANDQPAANLTWRPAAQDVLAGAEALLVDLKA
eukprot:comp23283_c1_seq1/m.38138 comp23283_c1_seq1/g.38138  ORF comp23283_c1_seq1/g.38138 comp23283_c1_seq1/m.38138 type:complete len:1190 (-) comp23283_c1_seq1:438-4007(-)